MKARDAKYHTATTAILAAMSEYIPWRNDDCAEVDPIQQLRGYILLQTSPLLKASDGLQDPDIFRLQIADPLKRSELANARSKL